MYHYKNKNNEIVGFTNPVEDNELILLSEEELLAITDQPRELTYAEKRSLEYPPITEYLDGIVKGDAEQVQAYIDACLAVKTKYPKV